MIGDLGISKLASEKLKHSTARQAVVAQNIANADTPGYKAKETSSFADHISNAKSSSLRATHDKHIRGHRHDAGEVEVRDIKNPDVVKLNGNTVSLEMETMKSAEIAQDHAMVTNMYKKAVTLLKIASSKG